MFKKWIVLLAIAILLLPAIVFAQQGDRLPALSIKEFQLKNGFRVVMHEDHSTPIVTVHMWYHVGSKNEAAGRTGFAHLFEHMLFQGSKNYIEKFSTPLEEAGGFVNGTTDEDRTYYYERVPSNFLELTLYLEADRLGNLLDAMTQEKLDNQRDVVKNEKRQRLDNIPYGSAYERGQALTYPAGHPYNWLAIGSMEDLSAASMDDVKSFFKQYYVPNNVVMVLSGDFNEKQARAWIEKYFGGLQRGPEIKRPNPQLPKINGEVRKTFEEDVPLPRLYMTWHGVRRFSADESALDVLSYILASGRVSRLQSSLVYGKQIAQNVSAGNDSKELAGSFEIEATARPDKTLAEIEKELNAEIERLKNEPPTADEMKRALNSIESSTVYSLQTVMGKGNRIGAYAGYLNKPNYLQTELDDYRKVTASDVQRVARKYLTGDRIIMSYLPNKGATTAKINPDANRPTSLKPKEYDQALIARQKAAFPKPGPDPKLVLPQIEKTKLSNGLEVWMVQQAELPIVSMNMVFKSGGAQEPENKDGIAGMTANLLDDGTKTRSAIDIANSFQSIGAPFNSTSGWDSSSVSVQTLTKNLDQALELYADVLVNPTFPEAELEGLRRRSLGVLLQQRSNAGAISDAVYNRVLYGAHPYGKNLLGTEKTLKGLTRDDIVKYYESVYRPNNATLIVVGDVNKSSLLPKLEKAFAGWKGGTAPNTGLPSTQPQPRTGIYLVDRPGAPQSVVSIGQVAASRDNPDYFALQVMNTILGAGPGARLSRNLRETKGYTYGAYSGFGFRRGTGPFSASADVQTAVTKESIQEFMKELNGIRGAIPVSQAELDFSKQSLIRGYPSAFETNQQISNQLANLTLYGLPDSYFNDFIPKINAVTMDDVNRVANKYLDPARFAIVVVGDRKEIEAKLKETGYPVTILDTEGKILAQ